MGGFLNLFCLHFRRTVPLESAPEGCRKPACQKQKVHPPSVTSHQLLFSPYCFFLPFSFHWRNVYFTRWGERYAVSTSPFAAPLFLLDLALVMVSRASAWTPSALTACLLFSSTANPFTWVCSSFLSIFSLVCFAWEWFLLSILVTSVFFNSLDSTIFFYLRKLARRKLLVTRETSLF